MDFTEAGSKKDNNSNRKIGRWGQNAPPLHLFAELCRDKIKTWGKGQDSIFKKKESGPSPPPPTVVKGPLPDAAIQPAERRASLILGFTCP